MRSVRKAILASAAAIVLVGGAGLAVAKISNAHLLDVRLPDGSLAHIRYVGDTPPTVSFDPAPLAFSMLSPPSSAIGGPSPFAALERMSEAMDRQADTMFRDIAAQPMPPFVGTGTLPVDIAMPPPGAQGFSMVSTTSANGVCTRSVQYRSLGDGKPPQVVSRTSGACTAADEKTLAPSVTTGSAAEDPRADRQGRQPI
jgi:hypothetical protein